MEPDWYVRRRPKHRKVYEAFEIVGRWLLSLLAIAVGLAFGFGHIILQSVGLIDPPSESESKHEQQHSRDPNRFDSYDMNAWREHDSLDGREGWPS